MTQYNKIKKLKRRVSYLNKKLDTLSKTKKKPVENKIKVEHPPVAFYKYMSQKVLLCLLRNKTIKFTAPLDFNDPMDSTIPKINIDRAYLERAIYAELSKENPALLREFKSEFHKEFNNDFVKLNKEIASIFDGLSSEWSAIINTYRVLSLTTKKDNLLMWSHYADQHRGIVVQFKKNPSFGVPKKVNYYDGYQKLNHFFNKTCEEIARQEALDGFSDKHSDMASDMALKIMQHYFFMKMSEWEYEDEYRIVYSEEHERIRHITNQLAVVNVSEADIECIYIGSSVPSLRAKRLKTLIQSKLPGVIVRHYRRVGWALKY